MEVDIYSLLGMLRDVAYCAGTADEAAKLVDSNAARAELLGVSANLKNTADDIRAMFDKLGGGD